MAQSLRRPGQPFAAECDCRRGRPAVLDAVGRESGGVDGVVDEGEGVGEVQDAWAGCCVGGRGVGGESFLLHSCRFTFLACNGLF